MTFRDCPVAVAGSERRRFRDENGGRVLHGARGKVGDRDDVEFLEGVLDRVVGVVEVQVLLRRLQRESGQPLLVRRGADANLGSVGAAFKTHEVPHRERDQVGGHLRRGREANRVPALARAWRVGHDGAVRNGVIGGVHDRRQLKLRLHRRLVEARKHASRVGRLELGDGVAAVVRATQNSPRS
jgi:hypothetical protein